MSTRTRARTGGHDWVETKHPRAADGKFRGKTGGAVSAKTARDLAKVREHLAEQRKKTARDLDAAQLDEDDADASLVGTDPQEVADRIKAKHRAAQASGKPKQMTMRELGGYLHAAFHPVRVRPRLERDPKTGKMKPVGIERRLGGMDGNERRQLGGALRSGQIPTAWNPIGPKFHVYDHGDVPGGRRFAKRLGKQRVDYVYRAVPFSEWQKAQQRGFLQRDVKFFGKGPMDAQVHPNYAVRHLPKGEDAVILKIRVHPESHDVGDVPPTIKAQNLTSTAGLAITAAQIGEHLAKPQRGPEAPAKWVPTSLRGGTDLGRRVHTWNQVSFDDIADVSVPLRRLENGKVAIAPFSHALQESASAADRRYAERAAQAKPAKRVERHRKTPSTTVDRRIP